MTKFSVEAPCAPALPRENTAELYKLYLAAYKSYLTKYGYYMSIATKVAPTSPNPRTSHSEGTRGESNPADKIADKAASAASKDAAKKKKAASKEAKRKADDPTVHQRGKTFVQAAKVEAAKAALKGKTPEEGAVPNVKKPRGKRSQKSIAARRAKRAPKVAAYNENLKQRIADAEESSKILRERLVRSEMVWKEAIETSRKAVEMHAEASVVQTETSNKKRREHEKALKKAIAEKEDAELRVKAAYDLHQEDLRKAKSEHERLEKVIAELEPLKKGAVGLAGSAVSLLGDYLKK